MTDFSSASSSFAQPAKDMARDIKEKATGLTEDVATLAKEQASQLGQSAKAIAGDATDKMKTIVREQKSVGADYLGSLAQATERAAGEFDEALPQAANYIRQASEQMQGVADVVRDRNIRELVSEVEGFARRQPTLFFGGAVVLGVAAMRFLKSSHSDSQIASTKYPQGFEPPRPN